MRKKTGSGRSSATSTPSLTPIRSRTATSCGSSPNGGTVLNCYNTDDFSLTASYPTSHIVYHLCDAGNGELWMSGMGRMSIFDTRTRTWKELPEAIRNESRLMQGDVDIIYNVDDRSILLNVIGKGMFHYYRTTERVLFQDDAGFPFELPDSGDPHHLPGQRAQSVVRHDGPGIHGLLPVQEPVQQQQVPDIGLRRENSCVPVPGPGAAALDRHAPRRIMAV